VAIPAGGYPFTDFTVRYAMGQQRRASGTWMLQVGQFYDGTITSASFSAARVALGHQWSIQPGVQPNAVRLPAGDFTTNVYLLRSDYSFSPLMFASGLIQYSSADHTFGSNLRFRWEYQPGSELFVVHSDERDTLRTTIDGVRNRAFVVKVSRLFRF
jgi:hypothetical protein